MVHCKFILKILLIIFVCLVVQLSSDYFKSDAFLVQPLRRYFKSIAETEGTTLAPEAAASANGNAIETDEEDVTTTATTPATTFATTSAFFKKCEPCPVNISCVPQIQCPAHVRQHEHEKPQLCDLPGDEFGYCCVTGQNHTAASATSPRTPSSFVTMRVLEQARKKLERLMHRVAALPVQRGQPDFLHGIMFHSRPQEDLQNFQLSNTAMEQVITTQIFVQNEHIPKQDIITNHVQVDFSTTPLAHHCFTHRACRDINARYRSYDGSCNNPLPHRSHWGVAGQPLERILPPAYEDGVWTARLHSVDGSKLTGARQISRLLLSDVDRPHSRNNLLHMQFGQFIAHDVTQTASVRWENGDLVQCCTEDKSAPLPADQRHFACLPIHVEPEDEFYQSFNVRCMNFVRLSLAPHVDCKSGYGKQRSKVTHYLDASPVYGSSLEAANELRSFHGGKLRMFNDFGRELLPLTDDKKACESQENGKTCFKSGDGRTNQIISLVGIHLLWAREHNRVAGILAHLNPHWSDELLYQEARRIVIAEFQHIVYSEYLPALVGTLQMQRFRLQPRRQGHSHDYNVNVNAAITNEFSGAAFRMGHSSVDGVYHMQREKNVRETVRIPDVMFDPSRLRERTYFDDMLRTIMAQPMQKVDNSVTHGLSRFLFRGHLPFGLDLAAINIQRGRDQGIRCYNDYLELMGHRKIHSFHHLPAEIGDRLAKVYHHPDDVDLWIGGLLEKPMEDSAVGVTFGNIIADQFSRFKQGDRYFYEYSSKINPGAFTSQQLHEIRKASMARIICDNADHFTLSTVAPAAFVRSDFEGNEPVSCHSSHIPVINLEAWRA